MSPTLESLEAAALQLSRADRSRLLERLIASLETDADLDAAWDAVADAREVEATADPTQLVPLEEALARLEARFAG